MNWLETQIKDQIAGRIQTEQSKSIVNFPKMPSGSFSDHAEAALNLVSEVAEAMKDAESRAAERVARAERLVNSAAEKLRLAQAHSERAEAMQRESEAEVVNLKTELKKAQAECALKATALVAAEDRAGTAEKRADDAQTALERVVHALRTQLPRKEAPVATVTA